MNEELYISAAMNALRVMGASTLRAPSEKRRGSGQTFVFSEAIRDKYVAARICRDLGIIDEITEQMYGVTVYGTAA